jgi:hypothetical protein
MGHEPGEAQGVHSHSVDARPAGGFGAALRSVWPWAKSGPVRGRAMRRAVWIAVPDGASVSCGWWSSTISTEAKKGAACSRSASRAPRPGRSLALSAPNVWGPNEPSPDVLHEGVIEARRADHAANPSGNQETQVLSRRRWLGEIYGGFLAFAHQRLEGSAASDPRCELEVGSTGDGATKFRCRPVLQCRVRRRGSGVSPWGGWQTFVLSTCADVNLAREAVKMT